VFGIGGWELLVIIAVALLVLGPRRLPAAARAVGKTVQHLRRATVDLRRSIELDPEMEDLPRTLDDLGRPIITRPRTGSVGPPRPRPDQDFGELPRREGRRGGGDPVDSPRATPSDSVDESDRKEPVEVRTSKEGEGAPKGSEPKGDGQGE
jgi:Tat protein translocase TatB subunit